MDLIEYAKKRVYFDAAKPHEHKLKNFPRHARNSESKSLLLNFYSRSKMKILTF